MRTLLVVSLVSGCAVSAGGGTPDSGPPPIDAGAPFADAATFPETGTPTPTNCGDGSADLVVLGFDLGQALLRKFDPIAHAFVPMPAPTGCPNGTTYAGRIPWTAALDRNAVLWTHYLQWNDAQQAFVYDRVFTIDLATSACTDTTISLPHTQASAIVYGLTFFPNPNDPSKDVLYASSVNPTLTIAQLDTLAMPNLSATTVGPLTGTAHSFLTSTADGHLYTLDRPSDGKNPWGVRELDPSTGATLGEHAISGLTSSQGPFVFWGGSLWAFFLAEYTSTSLRTDVYRIDTKTWTAAIVASGPFVVTAAAVSTCAPLAPPK